MWSGIFLILKFPFFFNLRKIYPQNLFLIFPVSSSVSDKKIFFKKNMSHQLSV